MTTRSNNMIWLFETPLPQVDENGCIPIVGKLPPTLENVFLNFYSQHVHLQSKNKDFTVRDAALKTVQEV